MAPRSARPRSGPRPRLRRIGVGAAVGLVGLLLLGTILDVALSPAPIGQWRTEAGRAAYEVAYDAAMEALPAPTRMVDVRVRHGVVRAYGWTDDRHTDRVPVLLVPGRSSGVPMWAEQVQALAQGRDVYALDAVGDAGRSLQSVPLASPSDQATWIADTLDALDLSRVHVVGHSFGGASAAQLARVHPDRVASLTLLEPAFTLALPPPSVFFWSAVATLPVPATWRDHALARIGGVSVAEVRTDDPMGRMIALGTEHYEAHLPTPTVFGDDELRSWPAPVYVAIADRDSLAGGERAVERAALMPGAVVEVWPDTTHSLPMQTGPDLTHRLRGWWDDLDRQDD